MDNKKFNILINSIPDLGTYQYRKLKEKVKERNYSKKISYLLETPINELKCPYCLSCNYTRWGKRNDMQRYKCKDCKKTFNSLTKTPLARLRRKGHWLDYAQCLKEGVTIREAASICGIHRNTSFRWRHRFVSNLKFIKAKKLGGIIEMGNTIFKESFKGTKDIDIKERKDIYVLYSVDRNNNVYDITNKGFNVDVLDESLKDIIKEDSLIISPKQSIFKEFSINNSIKFVESKNQKPEDLINYCGVENFNLEFQDWIMNHFRGVATKYLENYVSWYRSLNEFRSGIMSITLLFRAKSVEKYRYQPLKVTSMIF